MKARIGSVPYLNAKPLTEGLNSITYEIPTRLANCLRQGELDAALVPTLEVLECPDYVVVEGVAIGSQREVKSVFLTYQGDLKNISQITTDSESKTSVALAKLIVKELNLKVQWVEEKAEAQLMIGDRALDFRKNNPQANVLDLGQAWHEQYKLPFVFAVWAIRQDFPNKKDLANQLRQAKEIGIKQLKKYVKTSEEEIYLRDSICYELGDREKEAILRFQQELLRMDLLKENLSLSWV